MRVLFNCTTNIVGGGVKNAATFIKYAINNREDIEWLFAVSKPVMDVLNEWGVSDRRLRLFSLSPAKNKRVRYYLLRMVGEFNADLVYTMAGPAYVKFMTFHVMGISNPYITHMDLSVLRVKKSPLYLTKLMLTSSYRLYYSRFADFWVFQTEMARDGFIKRMFVEKRRTAVVPNALGDEFDEFFKDEPFHSVSLKKRVDIFCPAAGYWHKALHLVPDIASELRSVSCCNYDFRFILTLGEDSALWKEVLRKTKRYGVERHIDNIGPYNYTLAVSLFGKADVVFVPSVLETFSASYLEAFASRRPLVVADKGFARKICKDAAVYVDPFDARGTAETLHRLICDKRMQLSLEQRGLEVVKQYGLQSDRINRIIALLERLYVEGWGT